MKKISNKKITLASLKRELKVQQALAAELEVKLVKKEEYAGSLMGGIHERDQKISDLNKKYELQTQRLEIALKRQRIVELDLLNQIQRLNLKNIYFENNLFKVALKRFAFGALKGFRRCLPLTKAAKARLTSKLTGAAHVLNGDRHQNTNNGDSDRYPKIDLDIKFQECKNPLVSILIPVHNEISHTLSTLKSIFQQSCTFDYEVIVFDDASSDPFHIVLKSIQGLTYYRNQDSIGFVENCNRNFSKVRGQYTMFLGNGILMHSGCLQSMYETFLHQPTSGIVGGKLIDSCGDIQSIGEEFFDGFQLLPIGRGKDPAHPLYNYLRNVDSVDSQLFMIETQCFRELGGFAEGYTARKYAVADICIKIEKSRRDVVYQPKSSANEIEPKVDNEDSQKVEQVNSQKISQMHSSESHRHIKTIKNTPKGHILYVDATTPDPDKDAGSMNAVYSMKVMLELGYHIHFIPGSNFAHWGEATEHLQQMGIECIYHPFYSNIEKFLNERKEDLDFVVLSRAECNEMFLKVVKKICPKAKIIYNTVDLHFLRMEREAKLHNNSEVASAAKDMKKKELRFMRETDATIILSEFEYQTLAKINGLEDKLWTIPLVLPEAKCLATYGDTKDILFIGGYNHPPNVDAVDWLVEYVWPEIRKKLPGVKLVICGSAMPERFHNYACDDIEMRGFVADLDALMSETRLTIAPLRFGAGLKGKVASSIGAGVPCIGTSIAFEGMPEEGLTGFKREASTPTEFASLAEELYFDEVYWNETSKNGCTYYNNNFAYKSLESNFSELLESLKA